MGESNLMPISFGFFATIFVVETSPRLPHRESALAFVPTCSTSRDHPRAEDGQRYEAEDDDDDAAILVAAFYIQSAE